LDSLGQTLHPWLKVSSVAVPGGNPASGVRGRRGAPAMFVMDGDMISIEFVDIPGDIH